MGLKELYEGSNGGNYPYVNSVKSFQAADAGATPGVNFMDGQGSGKWAQGTAGPPNEYQKEFTRNTEGSFRYGAAGQNGQTPGTSGDVAGTTGLSRWTANALNIAFKDASSSPSLSSLWNRRKTFKTASPVNWAGYNSFHRWIPDTGFSFVDQLSDTQQTKTRVKGKASGPAPSGLAG